MRILQHVWSAQAVPHYGAVMAKRLRIITVALATVLSTGGVSTVPLAAQAASPSGRGHHDRQYATCVFTPTPENPAARPVTIPDAKELKVGTAVVSIFTNYGKMTFVLDRANAPCAVGNLVHLAQQSFYKDSRCFRLTNSQRLGVLQCGDIYRQEEGGPGYRFPDEVTGKETYPRGTIAMGNQGPGTNGSEFFIVHSHANISPNYTVMGKLVNGFGTLDRIVAAGIADPDQDGPPTNPVIIYSVKYRPHAHHH